MEQGVNSMSKERIDSGRKANIIENTREQISFNPYNYVSINNQNQL
jgi:hypothetical protein